MQQRGLEGFSRRCCCSLEMLWLFPLPHDRWSTRMVTSGVYMQWQVHRNQTPWRGNSEWHDERNWPKWYELEHLSKRPCWLCSPEIPYSARDMIAQRSTVSVLLAGRIHRKKLIIWQATYNCSKILRLHICIRIRNRRCWHRRTHGIIISNCLSCVSLS